MTDGWGRDYTLPPPPRESRRRWIPVVALAVVCVFAWSWVALAKPRATPSDPVPTQFTEVADEVVLPKHEPRLGTDGRAATVAVGDFEIAVLETDREAREDWSEAERDVGYPAALVMTTVYVKYIGSAPVDFTEAIEWLFGSQLGTNNGYNPWDDWCPAWRDSVLNVGLMLPGEARVLKVCVPVAPQDAAGLEMDVSEDPNGETNAYRTFGLPADGVVYPAPVDVPTTGPYDVAVAAAEPQGVWRSDTYVPTRTWIVGAGDVGLYGNETVRVAAAFDVRSTGDTPEGAVLGPELRGPSGATYFAEIRCDADAVTPAGADAAETEVIECWDVRHEDAHDLVAVFADPWWTGEWLVLRLPDPTAPA